MKLNKIFTFATLAAALLSATSCSDTAADYAGPGSWDANENYADVYFQTTSKTDMVDPAETPATTVELYRRNVSSAASIPLTVLENTDNVFTVSNAEFAAGDSVATVTVDYSKAEIGTPYKLVLTVDDPAYVSSYSSNVFYTYTVTRVKWNSLGVGTLAENYYFGMDWEVEILQRDDDKSYYRVLDPYWPTEGAKRSEYVELHVLNKGDKIRNVEMESAGVVDWYRINSGYLHPTYNEDLWLLHPQNFTSASMTSFDVYKNSRVSGYNEDGTPGQITLAPYYYLFGAGGGWNATTETDAIVITFPGFVAEYVASIDDYEWEPLFTGEYVSAQMGTKASGVTIYKGVPNDSIETANEGCYERFEETYGGTPYRIASPYTSGKDLVFLVKGKNITTFREDDEHDFEYQETGLTAVGKEVYANILPSSQFSENEINLDIRFQTLPDPKTDEYYDYGTATETLANITWTKVGTGTYTYTFWWEGVDPGYEVYKRDDTDNTYKIADWGGGVDFIFTWDKATNKVKVPLTDVGDPHPSYGTVYVSDMPTFAAVFGGSFSYDDFPCTYDPATSTFTFELKYFVSAGYFDDANIPAVETLEVTWDAAAARGPQAKHTAVKAANSWKLTKSQSTLSNRFVGKKAKATSSRNAKSKNIVSFDKLAE